MPNMRVPSRILILAGIYGCCKKPVASIYFATAGFPGYKRPSDNLIANENQQSGRALFFSTDLQNGVTDRLEQLRVMLRRHSATSHSMAPYDGGDGASDDDADDGSWVMLRHRARPSPRQGAPRARLPSPGSAREPAPPALRRTAPQSTGKQYASYPSPSQFLDGDFASRLTSTQAIAMPFH
jgi:hypothetical protein